MFFGGISLSVIITFFLPLSNAHLMWRPYSLHYEIIQKTEPTKAEEKLVSTSKKYKAIKSDRKIVPSTPSPSSDSSWLSERQDQPKSTTIMPKLMKIVPKTKLPKSKLLKSKSKQMTSKSTKKPQRQYNPLCFFSALPCTSRRKDVYYKPRRGHKRSVRRHTTGSKFE